MGTYPTRSGPATIHWPLCFAQHSSCPGEPCYSELFDIAQAWGLSLSHCRVRNITRETMHEMLV